MSRNINSSVVPSILASPSDERVLREVVEEKKINISYMMCILSDKYKSLIVKSVPQHEVAN